MIDKGADVNAKANDGTTPLARAKFNNDKQIAWDRTITPDPNSPKDANGQATGFIQAATFGTATQDNHYIQPYPGQNGLRAFRMAMGVRF